MNSDALALSQCVESFATSASERIKKQKEKVFQKGELADFSNEVTDDWYMASLFDVTHLITCGVAKRPNYVDEGVPFLSAQNARPFKANLNKIKYITKADYDKLTVGGAPEKNDILYTRVGNCGEAAKVEFDFDFAIYVSLTLIKPVRGLLNSDYLVAFLNSQFGLMQAGQGAIGIGLKNLNVDNVRRFVIPLPPLAEQKVIADKLDELLAQVESTKARLDAIPAILKSFRQSVLAAAVSGKLTEEWRGDISYLTSEHMEPWGWNGVPANWDVRLYSELTDSRLGKMLDKSKNSGSPTSYLGNINVRWFSFELNNLQEILVSEKELQELKVQYNDVLICEGGEPGRCAIWKSKIDESIIYQKALHRARVKNNILPEWLAYNLKSDADSLKLNQLFTGTTIKHLTGKALKRYPIRVPSIEEQTEIVRRVEELFAFADKVESQVSEAQTRVNNLTQSILAKAFRGELTEPWRKDNPELISGDNSAKALLERIKAEREALTLAAKAAKKKPAKKATAKKVTT